MSVRADRDPRTFGGDDAQPFHIEVLSVRIRVDLERGPGLDRATSDPLPIAGEPSAKVVNAAARMGEDLDVPILEAAKVSVGLVVAQTQLRAIRSRPISAAASAISSIVELPSVSSLCI